MREDLLEAGVMSFSLIERVIDLGDWGPAVVVSSAVFDSVQLSFFIIFFFY